MMLPQDWYVGTEDGVEYVLFNSEGDPVISHYDPAMFDALVLDAVKLHEERLK